MFDRDIDCLTAVSSSARPVQAIRPAGLEAFFATEPAGPFLRAAGFTAASGDVRLLPGADGVAGAVVGLGEGRDRRVFGALPFGLPEGDWRLDPADFAMADAVLGFCLGAYQYTALK